MGHDEKESPGHGGQLTAEEQRFVQYKLRLIERLARGVRRPSCPPEGVLNWALEIEEAVAQVRAVIMGGLKRRSRARQ